MLTLQHGFSLASLSEKECKLNGYPMEPSPYHRLLDLSIPLYPKFVDGVLPFADFPFLRRLYQAGYKFTKVFSIFSLHRLCF